MSLQLTGELELDVLWLKSADPGRPPVLPWEPNTESEALWRECSSKRPLGRRPGTSLVLELPSEDDGWLGVELRWLLYV